MVETAAASLIADIFAKEVDFFSIGTNDLTQYTMSVDRGNDKISYLYSTFNPAVLRSIRRIITCAREAGIMVGMCGEAASDPMMIPLLLAFGLNEFSMSASAILYSRKLITSLSTEELKAVADKAMSFATTKEVEDEMREFVAGLYSSIRRDASLTCFVRYSVRQVMAATLPCGSHFYRYAWQFPKQRTQDRMDGRMIVYLISYTGSFFLAGRGQYYLSGILLLLAAVWLYVRDYRHSKNLIHLRGIFSLFWVGGQGLACLKLSRLQEDWQLMTWVCMALAFVGFWGVFELLSRTYGTGYDSHSKIGRAHV